MTTSPNTPLTLLRYRTTAPPARARVQLPQHMFTFLLKGEKVVQFASARVTVHPSQVLLLGAGNCLMSEKAATPGGRYHSLLLLFDPALLRDFFGRHAVWLGQAPAAPSVGPPLLLLAADEFLQAYVRSLDCLLSLAGGAVPDPLLHAKWEELAALRHLGQAGSEELRVREAVTAHLASPGLVSVAELAFLCHMSKKTPGVIYDKTARYIPESLALLLQLAEMFSKRKADPICTAQTILEADLI